VSQLHCCVVSGPCISELGPVIGWMESLQLKPGAGGWRMWAGLSMRGRLCIIMMHPTQTTPMLHHTRNAAHTGRPAHDRERACRLTTLAMPLLICQAEVVDSISPFIILCVTVCRDGWCLLAVRLLNLA
jgi:hypothetical protein